MTYVRVDDQFTEHPKVLEIGPLAEALWLRGLLYASRNLTDGFVPLAWLRRMGDIDALELAPALVRAGLWHESEGGYRVHDYEEWQRSKEDIAAISRVRAEAGRRGGRQRATNMANAKQVASLLRSKPQAYTATATATDTDTEQRQTATAPPTPPERGSAPLPSVATRPVNGAASRWVAAVGAEAFGTVVERFQAANVQLDAGWLRGELGRLEAQHPGMPKQRISDAVHEALFKAEDAFARPGNRINHPRRYVAKELAAAVAEEARKPP